MATNSQRKSKMARYLAAALVVLAGVSAPTRAADSAPTATETKEQRDTRMAWWRQAKFGMFIHWGVYSVPAGTYDGKKIGGIGEWIMHNGKIPVARYAEYTKEFTAAKFNADQWAQIAQDAGMKYMVITAKHHDGFCMFHTKVDHYNIYDATPFHRDPVQELSEACPKHDVKFGVYYSQAQDWHHPGGGAYGGHWDKAQDGDYEKYLQEVSIPQVRELLANINPAVLWFDTSLKMSQERTNEFLEVLKTRPNLIYNNRLGNGVAGDTETPEQHIPPKGYPGRDWETCMTINGTWGYKSDDTNFKSTETLLHNLIDIASKGGNYLLNVGPTSEGVIPEPEVERLKAMGAWLKVNGEAIYGTGPTAFGDEVGTFDPSKKDKKGNPTFVPKMEWRCTTKPGKLFIHIMKWPGEKFELTGVKEKVTKAYLLAERDKALTVSEDGGKVSISLPAAAPDPIASVLCLEIPDAH